VDGETPKTKTAMATLAAVTKADKVLVVLGREDDVSWLSLRNLPQVHLLAADQLNTYDVLVSDELIFTKGALEEFGELASGTGRGGRDGQRSEGAEGGEE
jgi:large subunit ribosomal protein L4